MKKLLITAAAAATFFVPQVFAQSRNFEGLSLGVNLSAASSSTEVSGAGFSNNNGDTSTHAGVQAAYGFPLGDAFVFGIGATYDFGDLKGGSTSAAGTSYEVKGKDRYSVYFEPGFVISNSSMVYGKIGYQGMKGEINLSTGQTFSDDYFGAGYGAGIRTMVNRNVYFQAEFLQVNFDEKTQNGVRSKPSATIGTIGVGYKF
jgi:outer membrane immunogenic protein